MNNKNLQRIAIFFPLLLMIVWVVKLYLYGILGVNVRLKIVGYDPRNLLSGYYLRYIIDYGVNDICSLSAPTTNKNSYYHLQSRIKHNTKCVCLDPPQSNGISTKVSKVFWVGDSCADKPDNCSVYLEGQCSFGRFEAIPDKYYFPEVLKKQLNTVPENANIVVNIFRGKGQVKGIEVNGINIFDYVSTKDKTKDK